MKQYLVLFGMIIICTLVGCSFQNYKECNYNNYPELTDLGNGYIIDNNHPYYIPPFTFQCCIDLEQPLLSLKGQYDSDPCTKLKIKQIPKEEVSFTDLNIIALKEHYCKEDNMYLINTTLDDYNCTEIKMMIDIDFFIPVSEKFNTFYCNGSDYGLYKIYNTDGCKECASNKWKDKYFNECR